MSNRRPHGDGSITARGAGWRIRYDGPTQADGTRKQISETISGTKSKALAVLRKRIRSLETGQFVRPSQLSVGQYFDNWLRSHADNISPKTLENYASTVRNHIEPTIGQIKLQNLEPHHLSAIYVAMSEKQLSPATRAYCHKTMRKALGDATRQNLIASNPALSVTPPRQRRREPESWTTSQFNEFLIAAEGDEFRDFFELAVLNDV